MVHFFMMKLRGGAIRGGVFEGNTHTHTLGPYSVQELPL